MDFKKGAKRRSFLVAAGAFGAAAAFGQAAKWPSKQIRIIVAFPPGGLTDAYARHYAEFLGTKVGQQVVVENKPGAGAIIGIDAVAKSPPDGYTLLMTTSGTVWQNRVLYSKLPYNLDKDLTPIAVFPSGPLVVGVPEKIGVRNFKEFIAYAKKNPTSMGTYAPGSYPHMVADQINRTEGTKIQSVHYRGEAPMWVDVAGGQLQVAVGSYQAFNTVSTRGVRPIGVTGNYRSPKLPDVPTLVEQGIESRLVELEGGLPLMAPSGTPEAVLQALSRAAVEWSNTPTAAKLRESFAIPNKPKNLAETRQDWERDVPVWVKLAVDLGVKLD
ncbi:Bug family tripartite tricarboxylate transporter substrate binding protein [Ramlibacter albus]|uniref:Tripartite tricarboxylate transporter substrate binding protein n=1 Tax=Ramlibacter albus TaxID=2079448 RepID=A0A923S408_9BURK|nr:tripartite tricarboxylate transporter substrate binding protein [Ramlibacter albus]MBC5767119.1 tripartite tricarboxylate transporter substrate binding protein [Ramlibacter albus]